MPNQVWVSDITYVPTQEGWLYVATVLDLFSRKIVGLAMSSTGNCFDNAVAESFFHTLKIGVVHGQNYITRDQATRAIFEYTEVFYNKKRMHSSLNYSTPEKFEVIWHKNQKIIRGEGVY